MGVFIAGVDRTPFTGGSQVNGVWTGGVNRLDGSVPPPSWSDEVWTGSIDSISQGGVVSSTAGNGVVTITSQIPSGAFTGTGSRNVSIAYQVAPATPGDWSVSTAFADTIVLAQPGVDAPPPPPPTETYSAWTDTGDQYTDSVTTTGSFGSWILITTSSTQEFQNEQRCRNIETTTSTLQDQVRTCTAAGGCTGALTRTITIGTSFSAVKDCEVRETDTPNPLYTPPLTDDDIKDIAGSFVSIISSNGNILLSTVGQPDNPCSLTPEQGGWVAELAPGQSSSFQVIAPGGEAQDRNVKVNIQGLTPEGFEEECDGFDRDVTYVVSQNPATLSAPKISVEIGYTPPFGNDKTEDITDRTTLNIEIKEGSTYEIDADVSNAGVLADTKFGEGTYEATGPNGRLHTLKASNVAGEDAWSCDIIATSGGLT